MTNFEAHLLRVEAENAVEKFAPVVPGDFLRIYAGRRYPIGDDGWSRIWVTRFRGMVVAHCSVVGTNLGDGIVFGHISIEKPYRGMRIAPKLQKLRFDFLDAHGFTLLGPVAMGNDTSFHGCRRMGFTFQHFDADTGMIWVARMPGAKDMRRSRMSQHG